ncbi:MAG: hypothetical protein WBC44_12325 [Planctomycetaceae bacterium]
MNLRVLPEADGETLEAALWYEERRTGLGERFLTARELALAGIGENPQGLARIEDYDGPHEIRRAILQRFPYAVIVLCRSNELLVVAVAHLRRRPLYWLDRLDD